MKKGNINIKDCIKVKNWMLNSENKQSSGFQETGRGNSWFFSTTLHCRKLSMLCAVGHCISYLLGRRMYDLTFHWTPFVVQTQLVGGEFWPLNGLLQWWAIGGLRHVVGLQLAGPVRVLGARASGKDLGSEVSVLSDAQSGGREKN